MPSRKWLVSALALSLAVNLALGGFLAGRALAPGPVPVMLDPFLATFRTLRELPAERRDVLRPLLRQHVGELRPHLRRMRQAQRAVNQALGREPFDPDALDQALTEFRAALLATQTASHDILLRLSEALTPAERERLRRAMARPRGPLRPGPGPGVVP
jgi:uncharacterized membrane protein